MYSFFYDLMSFFSGGRSFDKIKKQYRSKKQTTNPAKSDNKTKRYTASELANRQKLADINERMRLRREGSNIAEKYIMKQAIKNKLQQLHTNKKLKNSSKANKTR